MSSKIFLTFFRRDSRPSRSLARRRAPRATLPSASRRWPPSPRSLAGRFARTRPGARARPRVRRHVLSLGRLAVRHRRGGRDRSRVWRDETRARSGARAGVASHGACRGHRDEVVRVAWHPTMTILATGSADGTACLWRVAQPGAGGASARSRRGRDRARGRPRRTPRGGVRVRVRRRRLRRRARARDRVRDRPQAVGPREAKVVQTAPSPRATRDNPGRPEARPRARPRTKTNAAARSSPERWRPGYLMSLASDAGARGLLASACTDGSVKVWALDQRAATPIASLPWHDGAMVTATAFASDDVLVSADSAGVVCATDVRTWTQTRRIKAPRGVYGICAAPNGVPWVAMCGGGGVVASRGGGGRRPNRRARRRRAPPGEARGCCAARSTRAGRASPPRGGRRRRRAGPRGPAGTLERARTFFDEGVVGGGGAVRGERRETRPRRTRSICGTRRREREKRERGEGRRARRRAMNAMNARTPERPNARMPSPWT